MKSQEEQQVRAQVEEIRGRLQDLTDDLHVVDGEVESLGPQRMHHELLERACNSLEQLGELGAAPLFWGDQIAPDRVDERLSTVRHTVSTFQSQLVELDERRQEILDRIGDEKENLEILGEDLDEILVAEERKKNEWIVERDISALPRRVQRMAWARGGEDDRRFHKTLASALMTGLLFGAVLPLIDLPLPAPFIPDEMPRRLAQLVRQEQIKRSTPPPPETYPEDSPLEKEQQKPENEPEPPEEPDPQAMADAEPQVPLEGPVTADPGPPGPAGEPRQAVQKAGILAFRDKFASLAQDKVDPRLGADARFGDTDDVSSSAMPTRSMLTTNAPGSSGGINIGSLSRNVGGGGGSGGGGGGIQGVPVGRATSTIASIGGGGGGGRPLARGGPGLSRTDEEIQIVFDRYKASFYRLYNRELRKDTTLRGQMVLRLTIEPDGSVSMCKLQSSDMNAPTLADQVVARVRTINFGAKEEVQTVTIVYPIDFLPAA
ncbi:MAG: AgmX/PglI C-terminal domain-containing protein [Acidobacteria bacterium]|uniref:AgmX/PglI C-terminal domain-containing protein n=1 Tax=Candidatus Polarisedimenticola svalbardensis TaxID=2886004 RepID=A0A8J6XZI5_9BACT|nr:AgmX/PglI C-terminal domain-containing protein [Candidatus Polarisedimenticola svalbardensis]